MSQFGSSRMSSYAIISGGTLAADVISAYCGSIFLVFPCFQTGVFAGSIELKSAPHPLHLYRQVLSYFYYATVASDSMPCSPLVLMGFYE